MSVVSDTGRGCRFGWSELGGVEAEVLLNCDLLSVDNLWVSRPRCWPDGEKSVSSAIEDKSEDEQLQNFTCTECSLNPGQATAEQPTSLKSYLKLTGMWNVSSNSCFLCLHKPTEQHYEGCNKLPAICSTSVKSGTIPDPIVTQIHYSTVYDMILELTSYSNMISLFHSLYF
jgi:hypothetical protein